MDILIKYLIKLFLIINVQWLFKCVFCFDVKFRAFYDAEVEPFNTQIYKREMAQFFDKASYSFNGFKKVESIPVLFPIDICILNLEGVKYAASLHKNRDGLRHFAIHKMNNGSYQLLADMAAPKAIAMDCRGQGAKGYIAIALNFSTPVENALEGSPIYELSNDHLRAIQYFATANLANVYLRVQGNDIMLLQTFKNTKSTPNLYCPYFKWSGSTFNRIGKIPCSNAHRLEPFSIDYEEYVAVANYADQHGRTSTYSEIYKFMREKKKFQLFQKIKTNGAVDVRYFSVPVDEVKRQHFLIFGNSISSTAHHLTGDEVKGKNLEADSIIYIFDKGQFVPYQRLNFYAVEQFLPIQNVDAEKFLLLVASSNQDIKIYNLNDWKFEESKSQFTEGALGKGVARMRIYQDQEESYLVIANEKMSDNETNIFLPIFKQEEHANSLRQQIIDWAKENIERLKHIDVEQLKLAVEQKLQNPTKISYQLNTDIPSANIHTVITESLTNPRLHINSHYWKALNYAQRALNVLEAEHSLHKIQKREIITDSLTSDYDFEHVTIDTLIVHNKLEAKNINGITNNLPIFKSIKAKEVVVTGKYDAPIANKVAIDDILNSDNLTMKDLNIGNLSISGKINGISWYDLMNNTLKREGYQFIKSPAHIENLVVQNIAVNNDEVNGMNLAKLVRINDGNFVVDQHIQFNGRVNAKNVVIHDRLNQIHVLNQKFDVLLTNSNKTQIVTGIKYFDNVRVTQPITMAGSLASNHLRAISPSKALHENLILQGDYIINGDVTIIKSLATKDLWDLKTNTSAKLNMENGLRIDTPLENVNIVFEQSIEANNTQASFINKKDMQQLVKSNTEMPQVLDGLKIFKQSLKIENGLSEVKFINGIDTENLAEELLSKTSNQTIRSPMHFGRVLTKGLQASNLTLNNKPLSNFLSKSGNQHINGNLKVERLEVENLKAENLNTNGPVFDKELSELYKQRPKDLAQINLFEQQQKFNGTIYVKNLYTNASLNEKPISDLERLLMQLMGNIKYVGNYKFNYEMNIKNLTFHNQFNGIKAEDFGNCWLRKTGVQTFTAPQTFASVEFKSNAILKGKLNGYALKDFYEQTYWINRNEYIREAIFLNPIELQKFLNTKTLNELHVPNDILYRKSNDAQYLHAALFIDKDLQISGSILNTTYLNGFNLNLLKGYINSVTTNSTLYLKNAHFSYAPKYKTLNEYNLQHILETVWLANENVELPYHVEISEVFFEGLLDLQGPINNMNMDFLKQNYMSRSKPQTIFHGLIFMKNVTFESIVQADEIHLLGPLIESKSKSIIHFDKFVSNTLKTNGYHEVRNNWTMSEVIAAGSLKDVTINGLNLATDAVRLDSENVITAEKRISPSIAKIGKLYTTEQSTINGVNIVNWFKNAAYINRNETIFGTTTLENAYMADLNVANNVNDKKFSKKVLWLKDQDQLVQGKVIIRNKIANEQRIMANNIKNLDTEFINGGSVNDFLGKIMKTTKISEYVDSHLTFEQPLVVGKYINDEFKWKRQTANEVKNWKDLTQALNTLRNSISEKDTILQDIRLSQVIPSNASKLIYLPMLLDDVILNLIGISNDDGADTFKFYRWSKEHKCFLPHYDESSWLPKDGTTLEIIRLIFGATDYITIKRPEHGQEFGKKIISSDGFKELLYLKKIQMFLEPLKLNGKDCYAAYGVNSTSKLQIYCLEIEKDNPLLQISFELELKTEAKQMLMLSNTRIALLTNDAIEVFNTTYGLKLQERFRIETLNKAEKIATCHINEITYLAIITSGKPKSLSQFSVEIYSSMNESNFLHQQTFIFDVDIQQAEFKFLNESQDLLLLISTKYNKKSLLIYKLEGVEGFKQIFSGGTLSLINRMQPLHLKSDKKHFVALLNADGVSFVEFVLKTL